MKIKGVFDGECVITKTERVAEKFATPEEASVRCEIQ